MTQPWGRSIPVDLRGRESKTPRSKVDWVAVEEPLTIEVNGCVYVVVMRTPGHDLELATGLLLAEGVIERPRDVAAVAHCRSGAELDPNLILARLHPDLVFDPRAHRRSLTSSSSCGLCGRDSIDALLRPLPALPPGPVVSVELLLSLPLRLREHQEGFSATGGLHAAGLFDEHGHMMVIREDVGRHNAVDKVIGAALRHDLLPLHTSILQVSGRVSFEIVQKARVAGIPILSAVSAPTSLAVDLAHSGGQTLACFVRRDDLNLYCGPERVAAES